MGNSKSDFKIVTVDDYRKDFKEKFSGIIFKGMTVKEAVKILEDGGYNKYKLWPHDSVYLTKILKREVIIYTDDKLMIVIREPDYM